MFVWPDVYTSLKITEDLFISIKEGINSTC